MVLEVTDVNLTVDTTIAYKWYKKNGNTWDELTNTTSSLTVTKPAAGNYTYRVDITANDITKPKEICFTVDKNSITPVFPQYYTN